MVPFTGSESNRKDEKYAFDQAKQHLKPGRLFHWATFLYADRKLVVFFWIHFVATMVTWAHFALKKWATQEENVPEGAPYYWLKRIAPPLEFGSMHAILLQMTLIPLSMCRFSIAALTESLLDRFVPLNRALRIHIHLGYTMIIIVFLATVFFFAFFGTICGGGDATGCSKFRDEIMITGYVILAFLLIIAVSSHFRHKIPYEIFYAVHHLVFLLYLVVIVHTLDGAQRNGTASRSQTFKWFSATLLYYICDRAAMHINHRYKTKLASSSAVHGTNSSQMLILKLHRPVLFDFKPGQYAFLRVNAIDSHWHPFSLGSGPSSSYLEFYVEVFGKDSWTEKLWRIINAREDLEGRASLDLEFEVMGPYGTSIAKVEDYSHTLAIGAGSGIVPLLSLFKQHVRQLIQLDPESYTYSLLMNNKRLIKVEQAIDERKGSVFSKVATTVATCGTSTSHEPLRLHEGSTKRQSRRDTLKRSIVESMEKFDTLSKLDLPANQKEMKKAVFAATRSIYGTVFLLAALPVIGFALIGFGISWNLLDESEIHVGMFQLLSATTIFFQVCFAIGALFVWDATQFAAYTDIAFILVSPFLDWYWAIQIQANGFLNAGEITLYCLMTGYFTLRTWYMTVKPRHRSCWRGTPTSLARNGVFTMDRLELVWVTRSSALVAEILPDIDAIWEGLIKVWGRDEEKARSFCRISIWVTEKDAQAINELRRELQSLSLYRSGWVHLDQGRPDFATMIEDHSLEMITTRRNSSSLLAFCGSPALASEIHQCKIANDMVMAITGNKKHQMEFASEAYGGTGRGNLGQDEFGDTECSEKVLSFSFSSQGKKSTSTTKTEQHGLRYHESSSSLGTSFSTLPGAAPHGSPPYPAQTQRNANDRDKAKARDSSSAAQNAPPEDKKRLQQALVASGACTLKVSPSTASRVGGGQDNTTTDPDVMMFY